MRTKVLSILASPCCKADLILEGMKDFLEEQDVSEGILTCVSCRNEYPIINKIPQLVIDLSSEEKNALTAIRTKGLVIIEHQKKVLDSSSRYKEIERIIRLKMSPPTDASDYCKQRFENEINFRVHGCEIQDKYIHTLKKYYVGPRMSLLMWAQAREG